MQIRQLGKDELVIVHELAHQIWPVAYREMISSEQMAYMLEWMYSLPSLHHQISSGHHFFIITDENHHPAGYASFSLSDNHSDITPIYYLHKLYVLPHLHKIGFGKMLLEHIVALIAEHTDGMLMLNVNRNNNAIGFYQKMGFTIMEEVDNEIGNGFYMNDYIMSRQINKL